jgi:peptidoglycan-associated lipoprotein
MIAPGKTKMFLAAAVFAALLPFAGCHKKAAAPPPPPPPAPAPPPAPTASLTATPSTITTGQSIVLDWSTTHATSVSIDGIGAVNTSGTQTVNPTSTTTYHLVARGDGGSAEASTTVTVNAPPPPPPPPPPAPAMTEAIFEENVKPVFFDFDKYDIRSDAQPVIAASAAFLQAHPDVKVLIAGNCDERGSEEYNLALGQNRANSAKTALVNAGVDAGRLRTVSYGKEKPVCTEHTDACWQQNRRDQFSIDQQ